MVDESAFVKTLIVVAGPTAVGKTDLSIRLAQEFATDIISADSRQIYKEMNVGTAKPSAHELSLVQHNFINSHSITQEYNAGQFETDALNKINFIFQKKDLVILTGGSGLYIQAVTNGLDEMPEIQPGLRENLAQELVTKGLPFLLDQLKSLDPVYYEQVDQANTQRVLRALEVCLSSGIPYSSYRNVQNAPKRPFNLIKIGLTRNRDELYARIDERMDQMLQNGLLEEAKALYTYRMHNALQTVGYKEVFDFLENKTSWVETIRLLKRNSRRYAKRQLTWFRKDDGYVWFHPDEPEKIISYIKDQLHKKV